MVRRAIFALVLLLAPAGGAQAALLQDSEFGRYHALVIGINAYKNLPKLEMAVSDASAVADLLRQKYGFEVTLLLNPGRTEVIRALDMLRGELTDADNLLFYYAGHGVLDIEADARFWMSVDAEDSTQADWISIAIITSTVRTMSAKHIMVVSDSCYSGRLTRGLTVSIKSGSERVEELTRLAAKRSRTALVSCGLEPVADGGGEGHSVFTRAFLTALREGNEVIDGQQLFSKIRRPVVVRANQTSEYSDMRLANHEGGDFLFVTANLNVSAPPAAEPEPAGTAASSFDAHELELAFWNLVADSVRSADFQAYLDQYPNGMYAVLARNRLKQFGEAPPPEPAAARPAGLDEFEIAFWNLVNESVSVPAYAAYLERFPDGTFTSLARIRLDEIEAQAAPPQETALVVPPSLALIAAAITGGAKVTYDTWKYRVTARSDGDIDADGDDQRLLFGLIRIGWQAIQEEHDLAISDKELGKLAALFPLQTGSSVSFKLIDLYEERAVTHKDRVKVQIVVRERTQMAFDGNTYEVWAIDTQMKPSSPGAGNASTIRRRFLFSETLGIAFRVEEEMDRDAKSWEIVTHGDYVLTRIDRA
jgi:hypothetical protein